MTAALAPLLVKWLTHDLASPIATVLTASELLSDTPDAEINGLVTDAARRLAARRAVRSTTPPAAAPAAAPASAPSGPPSNSPAAAPAKVAQILMAGKFCARRC